MPDRPTAARTRRRKKKSTPRPFAFFRPRAPDVDAGMRVKDLLSLPSEAAVIRLGIHVVHALVESCESVELAREKLGPALDMVLAVRRGRGPKRDAA